MRIADVIGEAAASALLDGAEGIEEAAGLMAQWKARQGKLRRLQAARTAAAEVTRANQARAARAAERVRAATAALST